LDRKTAKANADNSNSNADNSNADQEDSLSNREIQTAVRNLIPGQLSNRSVSAGTLAVTRFSTPDP
jgi:hypothetical protein